jgi:hypothetical protein
VGAQLKKQDSNRLSNGGKNQEGYVIFTATHVALSTMHPQQNNKIHKEY